MGLLEMLVGPLGSGKSTRAAWRVLDYKQRFPWVPRVGNLEMNPQDIAFVPDVLRFLALKFVRDGNKPESERVPMLIIVDEANTSGLEARGSGFSPGQTTVLQFVRKLKVHCMLISPLMSMTDRRGQWLAHYYTLCKGIYRPGGADPIQFEYKIYDEGYRYQKTEYLRGSFCQQYIFPRFDSWSIPNYDAIAIDLIRSNKLTTQDFQDYNNIVKFYASLSPIGPQEKWFGKKWNAFWDMSERQMIPPLKVRRV